MLLVCKSRCPDELHAHLTGVFIDACVFRTTACQSLRQRLQTAFPGLQEGEDCRGGSDGIQLSLTGNSKAEQHLICKPA